jgi:hypothetical protein
MTIDHNCADQLIEKLIELACKVELLKEPVYMDDPNTPRAVRNSRCAAISYALRTIAAEVESSRPAPAQATERTMSPWHPISDAVDLKHLGKFSEELGECQAAVARCIIQGVDEREPVTGKVNRHWLEEEIADVRAGATLAIKRFDLNEARIEARAKRKIEQLRTWHLMA